MQSGAPQFSKFGKVLSTQGIEPKLAWGFVGVTFFMIGDGLELGFLPTLLDSVGFSGSQVGLLLTMYGVTVAIASWLAGALSAGWGPRRVMLAGFVIWFVLQVLFIALGVMQANFGLALLFYTARGAAYPLFQFGFLAWVTMATPEKTLGRAVGWFWFFSSMGLGVISAYWAGFAIPFLGQTGTIWTSLFFVSVGCALIYFLVRDVPGGDQQSTAEKMRQAAGAVTVAFTHPRVGVGGLVRMVNSVAVYSFGVFLPVYMTQDVGFKIEGWQFIWGTMQLSNIIGNVLCGYLGDKLGRVRVVRWLGCLGTAIGTLLIIYMSIWAGASYPLMIFAVVCYGFALAAFVPLSAIVPLLARENKAAAIAILNLGAGLAHVTGALIPTLFLDSVGVVGVIWIVASVYMVGFFLTYLLEPRRQRQGTPDDSETTYGDMLDETAVSPARAVGGSEQAGAGRADYGLVASEPTDTRERSD
ncbi:MFS transporter [Brevibacterium sp. RIT 803]|uniref:MFS transporter n=1 Tax=Brevibacterium sp. RIT 803 TaxID=2810210 RepID=UPI00194FE0E3|nr:MFS transporter [Brevibacterium sp. RIT 803]